MRYIDIVRAVVRNAQEKDIPALTWDEQRHHINAIRKKIDDIEIVVRCKDCKYSHMTYDGRCKYCDKWEEDGEALYLEGDFYCAYGKRKGGDDE